MLETKDGQATSGTYQYLHKQRESIPFWLNRHKGDSTVHVFGQIFVKFFQIVAHINGLCGSPCFSKEWPTCHGISCMSFLDSIQKCWVARSMVTSSSLSVPGQSPPVPSNGEPLLANEKSLYVNEKCVFVNREKLQTRRLRRRSLSHEFSHSLRLTRRKRNAKNPPKSALQRGS